MSPEDRLYSTDEVVRFTGVTYRRVDSWTRLGYVAPDVGASGSGSARRWSLANIDRVCEIRDAFEEVTAILRKTGVYGAPQSVAALMRKGTSGCCHVRHSEPPQHSSR